MEEIVEKLIKIEKELKSRKDKDKLDEALGLLCREDQTLRRSTAEETGQRVVSGMGELHLEVSLKRVTTDFGVDIRIGEPRVAYRETLVKPATIHTVFNRTVGDATFYAEVTIEFKPLELGGEARMNCPGLCDGTNWVWRAKDGVFTAQLADKLKKMTGLYGR